MELDLVQTLCIAAECWARKRFLGLMADVDQTTAHSVLIASSQVNQVN